jgi:hypothetical protein
MATAKLPNTSDAMPWLLTRESAGFSDRDSLIAQKHVSPGIYRVQPRGKDVPARALPTDPKDGRPPDRVALSRLLESWAVQCALSGYAGPGG